ncbi:MAG TPA: fasciclin domain-containing protein [Chitinophaga sp.]
MKRNIVLASLLLLFGACKKDDAAKTTTSTDDNNRLLYVIEDNKFNFSQFNAALDITSLNSVLLEKGPYTVLLPDNNAFSAAGYGDVTALAQESGTVLNNMIHYHILKGTWELDKLPYRFNQSITTLLGAQLFVTHWVKGPDTVITINGTKVTAENLPASNGLIQVINAVMPPLLQDKISDAIAADASLTFFNTALQTAGMKDLLAGEGPFTVFAPNNTAWMNAGFPSEDSVAHTNPAVLKALLEYQIAQDRRFIYDYVLSTDESAVSQQTMLNKNYVTINLLPDPSGVGYSSLTITGTGNATPCKLVKSNVLSNNGVLHIIDQMIKENF